MARSSVPVFVVLLTCAACSRPARLEGSAVASDSSAPAAAGPRSQPKMRGWQLGQEYGYRFQTSSRISLGEKALLYDFDLNAHARVIAINVTASAASFYLVLENAQFVSRVPGSQADFDRLSSQLKQPYFFDLKAGLVSSVSVPQDLHPLAIAVFRSFSASLQFAAHEGKPSPFTTTEFDTTGQYTSQYTPSSNPLVWHKQKQKYLGILLGEHESKEAKEVAPKIVSSKAEIRLSPEGRPIEVSMTDELDMASAQAPLHSNTVVSLLADSAQVSKQQVGELIALRGKLVAVAANAPFESAADRESLDDAKINGATFDKVLAKFEQIARAKTGPKATDLETKRAEFKKQADAEGKLFVALGALFRAQPATVEQAVTKIKAQSAASDVLLDALGSAGTADAQKVLIAFVKDRGAEKLVRGRAMLSLSRTENPTPESVQTLLGLISDEQLGTQALYGIGNYARAFVRDGKLAKGETLGGVLLHRLDTAKSEMKLIEALRAIANSGFAPALGKVKPYLTDAREQVRVDAVAALALMADPAVDAILVERLTLDSAKKARLAALDAIGGRAPNDVLLGGLRHNLDADDPHVRYRAVETIIRWLPKRGELREALQQIAQNDSEAQIRDLAKAAL
jgi:HEAT repeat protein